jgi:hypothetical protein
VQITASALAVVGYFLGHKHKGRQFAPNVHSSFAPWLMFILLGQIVAGVYLKLHIERGFLGKIRNVIVMAHGISGKVLPIAAWVQMLFGGITSLGFCRGDHLGQCLAHFIMGSAFIGYGVVLTLLLLVGQGWLRKTGRSQEFFDSLVIAAWGCVNTFTEHRWGSAWVHNDIQHTTIGVVWWCAGLVGMWLSRRRNGSPKRNIIPAMVIFLTGYAMSGHPQSLMISTMVHRVFGYTLMGAGAARLIEISFVLKDKATLSEDGTNPNSFQHLPPFVSGCPSALLVSSLICTSFSMHLASCSWVPQRSKCNCSVTLVLIISLICSCSTVSHSFFIFVSHNLLLSMLPL